MPNIDFTLENYIEMLHQCKPPASFREWLNMMMAAKAAGIPYEDVDAWNRQDPEHYNAKENLRHWNSIIPNGGITPATLVKAATAAGWQKKKTAVSSITGELNLGRATRQTQSNMNMGNDQPHYISTPTQMARKTVLGAVPPVQFPQTAEDMDPIDEFRGFIQAVYAPNDSIRIVTSSCKTTRADGTVKYSPNGKGFTVKAGDLMRKLASAVKIEDAIGEYDHSAGAWIGMNPVQDGGSSDKDVTNFRNFLVEIDEGALEIQLAQLKASGLPITAITYSGNKSLHALVKTPEGITTPREYKEEAEKLFNILKSLGMNPDTSCNNASRLTRLPGVERADKKQCLIDTEIGMRTYEGWMKTVNLLDRNLEIDQRYGAPSPLASMVKPVPANYEWIVDGLLRPGQMMEIIGKSKAGKSLFALQMCIAICNGMDFLGLACRNAGRILYCNLEITGEDMYSREIDELNELGITHETVQDLLVWNLRGADIDIDRFIDDLAIKVRTNEVVVVVLDPVYILFKDVDENDNSGITSRFTKLQRLMRDAGCALVIVHHESDKKDVSQPIGASAFVRMYDTLLAVDRVKVPGILPQRYIAGTNAYKIAMNFRHSSERDPIGVWRNGTTFFKDETGILAYCENDPTGNDLDKEARKRIINEKIAKLK